MRIGLRIDADTFRGTRHGIPNLLRILEEHHISSSFFLSVGPDNMGRHLFRLFRPSFFRKMVRSKAAGLYGWDILWKGTFRSGPVIGERLGGILRSVADLGHEVGLHAWDHHGWQSRLEKMGGEAMRRDLKRGFDMLSGILGRPPTCSAAPGWRCSDRALLEKLPFPFRYNSDCRGESLFHPVVDRRPLPQVQIPVTLPTYDEAIGRNGISDRNYNEYIYSLIGPGRLNVLAIHAEVEGIARLSLFDDFLRVGRSRGVSFVPLGALLREGGEVGCALMSKGTVPGREGWVSRQAALEEGHG
jgi:undecaprenyl phosphate-alpha-L-ara4FN deformylase